MNSNSNYETLYGVGLLDDLHNYFPALLYDSSSFGSVQDVLRYIQQQTRARFDLFSYGQREYQSTHPAPSEHSYRRVVRTSFASVPTPLVNPISTLPTNLTTLLPSLSALSSMTSQPSIQVELNRVSQSEEEEEEEDTHETQAELNLANALLGLLQIPNTALTRNYVLPNLNDGRLTLNAMMNGRHAMDQFLQPVVVRPTPQQIAENTTVGNLVSDTDHSCAICQDTLTSEQEGRKLNACGHWFHRACIDTWLQGNVHCPVCRHDIREPLQEN